MFNLGLLAYLIPAETAEGAAEGAGGGYMPLLMLLGVMMLMYFVMIIPERKRRKKLEAQLKALKQGDKVMTQGGIIGEIDFIGDKTVYIKSQGTKIEVVKESVVNVINPTESTPTK